MERELVEHSDNCCCELESEMGDASKEEPREEEPTYCWGFMSKGCFDATTCLGYVLLALWDPDLYYNSRHLRQRRRDGR